jgi:hypothetical protein
MTQEKDAVLKGELRQDISKAADYKQAKLRRDRTPAVEPYDPHFGRHLMKRKFTWQM